MMQLTMQMNSRGLNTIPMREHKPLDLKDVETENQGCMPQQPEFDNDGGLEHATSSIVEPPTTLEVPHYTLPPATNEVICSTSESCPPPSSAHPPPPHASVANGLKHHACHTLSKLT